MSVDLRVRLSRAAQGSVVITVATLSASFLSQVGVGRRFGPVGLGEYGAASLFIAVVSILGFVGMPVSISQRLSSLEATRDPRLTTAAGAALTLSIAVAVGAGLIAGAAWPPFAVAVDLARAPDGTLVGLAVASMILQYFVVSVLVARLRMPLVTMIVLAQPAAVAAAVGLSYVGAQWDGGTLAVVGSLATGLAAAAYLVVRPIRPAADLSEIRALLRGAGPGTSFLYVNLVTSWVDRLLVALITGPAGLGSFSAASSLVEGVLRLPRSLGNFSVSAYAHLADDVVGARRVLDSHVRIFAAFLLVASAILVASGGKLLPLVFGPGFTPAVTTLQLLSIAIVPIGISFALASSGVGVGELRLPIPLMLTLLVLQVATGLVGGLLYSIAGIALAHLTMWSIQLLIHVSRSTRRQVSVEAGTVGRLIAVAVPVIALAFFLSRSPLALPVQAALGGAAGLVAAKTMLASAEWRLLRRLVASAG